MIFKVNGYNEIPTFFVDQSTFDSNQNYKLGNLVVGSKEDADSKLLDLQNLILSYEAVRFSICATFVNGDDTEWREIKESDPEETICQVLNHNTGQYTQCNNKTEAFILNEKMKQDFLVDFGIDKVIEQDALPQPIVTRKFTESSGSIDVAVFE